MNYIFGAFLSYLLLYRYATLALVVFVSALFLPLPINTLLIAVGAFATHGYFSFVTAAIVTLSANVAGDCVDYWLVRQYGHAVLREKFVHRYSYFLRIEEYIKSHSRITIVISRVIGVLGPPVNFLAGYAPVPFGRFLLFDVIGNSLYALIFLGTGYLVGDAWSAVSGVANILSAIGLILVLLGVLSIVYRRKNN